jgi:mannose-1-phosphate guanylyltransferase
MYHAVVLCGGSGTRLWPLTRQSLPKQFLSLTTARPLLVETVERLKRLVPTERIWLVGGRPHERLMREMAAELPPGNVIVEPTARDSTGAVGLAMARLLRRDPEAVFTAFHSDHIIANLTQFDAAVRLAARIAETGPIVNVGVAPTRPETGYGYVERGAPRASGDDGVVAFDVVRFVEKPSAERAAEYLRSGTFLWNVGLFTWRAAVVRDLLAEHLAGSVERFEETEALLESEPERALELFAGLPRISIDYAILEKATNRVVVEADLGWLDIGDWAAVYSASPKDADGNVLPEAAVAVDTRGTHASVARPGKLVATIGLEDVVVVDTEDALLVARRDRAQEVRKVIDALRARGLERFL